MPEPKPDVRPGDVIEISVGAYDAVVSLLVRVTSVFLSEGRRMWAFTGYYIGLDEPALTCGHFVDHRWRVLRRGGMAIRG